MNDRYRTLLPRGLVAGVLAFVGGYLITYLSEGPRIESRIAPMEGILQLFQAEPLGTWRVVGWVFYGAHFVDTRIQITLGPIQSPVTVDLIAEGAGAMEILYIVPPVLLLLAGAAVAWSMDVESVTEGATAGALVVIGYGPVIAIGVIVFAYNGIQPEPLPAIVIAGIAYPIICGGIGGGIVGFLPS